jgi:endoglucanase
LALAYAQADRLGRGVNFGNALDAPHEGDWGMFIHNDYFQHIKEAGFDTISVPITL